MPNRSSQPVGTPRARRSFYARLLTILLQQVLALVVLVGMPALFTAMAPVSWVTLQRQEGRVAASVRTCLLFIVPYRTQTLEPVVAIGDRVVAGTSTTADERLTDDPVTKTEDTGFLEIRAPEGAIDVCVSPASLPSVVDRARAFLDDPQAAELRMLVVANWKASVVAGGCVSLLAAIFLAIVTSGLVVRAINTVGSPQSSPQRSPRE